MSKTLIVIVFIGVGLCHTPFSAAEESIIEALPQFERVTRFSALGNSFSIVGDYVNRTTEPYRMVVINLFTGQAVRFDSGLWLAPAIFFDEGRMFMTATVKYVDGPTTYTVYDLNGNVSAELITKDCITASSSGEYFYSINSLLAPARPIVYSADFTKLKEFVVGKDVSGSWDANIIRDSIYLLNDRSVLRLFRLPSFDLLREYRVKLGPGIPWTRLLCNESGTLCAISNSRSLTIINTVTGFTQAIPFEFVDKIHLSADGNRVYAVRGRQRLLIIEEYDFDGETFFRAPLDTIMLSDYFADPVKAMPQTILELPDGIAINLLMIHGERPENGWLSVANVFCVYPQLVSQSLQVRFTEGVIWQDNTGGTARLRRLTQLSEGRARVTEITATGEEVAGE